MQRYLTDSASPEDVAALRAWLDTAPGRATLGDALERARQWRRAGGPAVDVEWALGQVQDQITARRVGTRRRTDVGRWGGAIGVACAASLVLAVALGFWHVSRVRATGFPAERSYATAAGERAIVTLSDGSRFVLAPFSRLRVPLAYGRATRDVGLRGEAYFVVTHDPARPFRVYAANVVTTDVGTAFDVSAYHGDVPVRVAVVEGKVSVQAVGSDQPTSLSAGHVALVDASGRISARAGDAAAMSAWTGGMLVFDATALPEVLATLSRWYGSDLRAGDSATAAKRVTITVSAQEGVGDVIDRLASAIAARVERRGSTILLVRP